MTRRPDLLRACHQLERHRSGTPNTPPPVRPAWAENLAQFGSATTVTFSEAAARLRAWRQPQPAPDAETGQP
jgi:hypothetical protein